VHSFPERREAGLSFSVVYDPNQHSNAPCAFILLRVHCKWIRRECSAYKGTELAAPHGSLQGPTTEI
jgi:hypothetical protein